MKRRDYLATGAVFAGASLSGCTAIAEEISLENPATETDTSHIRHRYEHGDREIVSVGYGPSPDTPSSRRLRAGIQLADDVTFDEAQFRFTPEVDERIALDLYLKPPPEGWYDNFDIYREDNELSFGLHDLGRAEYGDIAFEILVYRGHDDEGGLPILEIENEITVSADGFFGEVFTTHEHTIVDFDEFLVEPDSDS